jgi:PAS domain S-box-containing protein
MHSLMDMMKRKKGRQAQTSDSFEAVTDRERRRTFLRYINRGWFMFGVVTLVALPIVPEQRSEFIFLVLVIFPTYLVTRLLNGSGRTRLAGVIFTIMVDISFYGLFIFLVRAMGAERAFDTQISVWMLMGLTVLFAGAFIHRRAALIFAFINTILLIATRLILAPNADPRPSAVVFWWMLAFMIFLYERTLNMALTRVLDELATRKQVETALRTSETQYRSLVEKIPGAVMLHFAAQPRRVVYVSPAIEDLLGYTADDWVNDKVKWKDLIHPLDTERILAEDARTDESGESFKAEYRMVRKDGSCIWVSEHSSMITNEAGKPLYWQCLYLGITERKQAEQEREKLIAELTSKNAELERFVYTVSHDLKSPLVTIKGFMGYLEQDAMSRNVDRLKHDLLRISGAVEKMQALLNSLLELSRIGRFVNPSQLVPFEELAREAVSLVDARARECNITVKILVEPSIPVIYGDKPRLIEVLQNLLENAVKYMGDQSEPQIEIGQRGVEAEHGNPIFYVRDNGMGIAPEYHERVFGLFNKLDARSEGTGIGLTLVRRILEFHECRIWVESEAGKGSTFLFTLPIGPSA